jgi:hypothetical protein
MINKRRKPGQPETRVYAMTQLRDPGRRPVLVRSELRRTFAFSRDAQARSAR